MNSLKLNISKDHLLKEIKKSIKNKSPLSYVRLGDGEIHCLKKISDYKNPKAIKTYRLIDESLIKRSGGDANIINVIKDIVTRVINESDFLGIVDTSNLDKESQEIYGISTEILNRHNIYKEDLKLCSATFNRSPHLGNIYNFKKLIHNSPIHIMTSNKERLCNVTKIQKILGVPISYTHIPHIEGFKKDRSIFKRQYVKNRLSGIKEHVILYALGGGCKDFCSILKNEYGKCVIDMGSVMDAWAGLVSRPKYRTAFKHCMIGERWITENRR